MTRPLWDKGGAPDLDARITAFTAGDDVLLDRQLFGFDIEASRAHAQALANIGVLNGAELSAIEESLKRLLAQFASGEFVLDERFEDGHSAIEAFLTDELGDTGKKIHTGRSRNDQVLVATRLYLLDALTQLRDLNATIAGSLLDRATAQPHLPMPGYTHLQRAVVSSTGLWFGGFAEAFIDNATLARDTHAWCNANPLGTAAGFGVNLPLDRHHTTQALGFARLQVNAQYAQNSRGKFELQTLSAFAQALLDVRRLAWDLSLFASAEFDFVDLPDRYTTGSSIMPNKRNPDVIELLRGSYAVVQGAMAELQSLLSLPSGYHRDLQLSKAPLLRAVGHALQALSLLPELVDSLVLHEDRLRAAITPDMLATDVALELAATGMPFRDAYRVAMQDPARLRGITPEASIAARVSLGGAGNLMLEELRSRLQELRDTQP